eukprot:scaffold17914_cov62-Phaeocystis_antarctica.AAC.1
MARHPRRQRSARRQWSARRRRAARRQRPRWPPWPRSLPSAPSAPRGPPCCPLPGLAAAPAAWRVAAWGRGRGRRATARGRPQGGRRPCEDARSHTASSLGRKGGTQAVVKFGTLAEVRDQARVARALCAVLVQPRRGRHAAERIGLEGGGPRLRQPAARATRRGARGPAAARHEPGPQLTLGAVLHDGVLRAGVVRGAWSRCQRRARGQGARERAAPHCHLRAAARAHPQAANRGGAAARGTGGAPRRGGAARGLGRGARGNRRSHHGRRRRARRGGRRGAAEAAAAVLRATALLRDAGERVHTAAASHTHIRLQPLTCTGRARGIARSVLVAASGPASSDVRAVAALMH